MPTGVGSRRVRSSPPSDLAATSPGESGGDQWSASPLVDADGDTRSVSGDAELFETWSDACRRLERLGAELQHDPFRQDRDGRVASVAHLVQQLVCWLEWSVLHADPRRPAFHRQNDLITPWGGPNADNVYRHTRVAADRTYRIRGRMNSCEEFMLAIRAGFMGQPTWGTLHQVEASDLGIAAGDDFELFLGGPQRSGNWIPLPEGAVMASFREYYFDWRALEPAVLTVECLDDDAKVAAPPRDSAAVTADLRAAIDGVEHSIRFWNDYLVGHRATGTDNEIAQPMKVAKGLAAANYGFGFWDMADDDAIVLESSVPDARYWSVQLYDLGTYELVDPADRITSLNHRQAQVDPDGKVRFVLSNRDPGVANWLDTGGRRTGQFTFRWFWANGDPTYSSRLVRVDELADALPPDGARVTAAARAATMDARRQHLAWRFRT